MNTQQFEGSTALELQQTDHDLSIKGWDRQAIELTVDGDTDQFAAREQDGVLIVQAHAPLAIRVPRAAAVTVGQVSGDLLLRDLDRAVTVDSVHGDASVRSGQASLSFPRRLPEIGSRSTCSGRSV